VTRCSWPTDEGAEVSNYSEIFEEYVRGGVSPRIGYGQKPAIVTVDLMQGFTDPSLPMGREYSSVVEAAACLMALARSKNLPVVAVRSQYTSEGVEALNWLTKTPKAREFVEGSTWVAFDSRLGVRSDDVVVVKRFASAFFGTTLTSLLTTLGVDTVVVTGCITGGCVRATALDSHQYGFRTIVPMEAVGDHTPVSHWASLVNLDRMYADVVSQSEVSDYLDSF